MMSMDLMNKYGHGLVGEGDDSFVEKLKDVLPHGSGINYDWIIYPTKKKGIVRAGNKFDTMTEAGFYDVAVPFELIIPVKNPKDFKLVFLGGSRAQYYARKYMLRDYLDEIFAEALGEIKG